MAPNLTIPPTDPYIVNKKQPGQMNAQKPLIPTTEGALLSEIITTRDGSIEKSLSVRYAGQSDIDSIVQLSGRVQDTLTASGSVQQIGPLETEIVSEAADSRHCFVAQKPDSQNKVVACALVHPIQEGFYSTASGFDMKSFPSPWLYMHAVMIDPASQGQGSGLNFVTGAINKLKEDSRYANGTVLLGCWVGSSHLRRFYTKCGFELACVVPKEDYEVAVFCISLK